MIIREYKNSDSEEVRELFYNTVQAINKKDYNEEQLKVWATKKVDLDKWNKSLLLNFAIVAIEDNIIVGFGDINKTGYLDRLYVHKNYQSKGIATEICNKLEAAFKINEIIVEASITAKTFFEKRGYRVIKKQTVERKGVFLENYLMKMDNSKSLNGEL
ncbi:MAG: GNAT family N-acetyltransferase [Sarcina sp.]